jgi:uroporphyrinogen-III synthase
VDLVEAYRTVRAAQDDGTVERVRDAEAVTFTSSSTVTAFVEAFGAGSVPAVVVCIGPVTADAATAAGLSVTAVSERSSVDAVVETLVRVLSPRA